MRRRRRERGQLESSINVTPMGDVSLCLLLGFLVITPMIMESLSATLPQTGGAAPGQARPDPVVELRADGTLLVDEEEVPFEALETKIEELFPPGAQEARRVVFTGSGEVEYQEVIRVLDRLRELGVETFGIR